MRVRSLLALFCFGFLAAGQTPRPVYQKSGDRFLVAYTWHGALHASTVAESLESCGFDIRSQVVWVTF